MACEFVSTGWYSTTTERSYQTSGDEFIRGVDFRPLWWRSLDEFIAPEHVFIVDSASPVKADDHLYTSTSMQKVELLVNPGHSQNGRMHYCGYMASVLLGLEHAMLSDVDMYLYVEQDALIFGKDIIERIKNSLRRKDLVFGGSGKRGDIQQSFFAVNKRGMRRFLAALHAIEFSDKQVAPEHKFMSAGSRFSPPSLLGLARHDRPVLLKKAGMRLFHMLYHVLKDHELLPFGYGSSRPINFNDPAFYFQQGSASEIDAYRKLTGF